ncbi:hypothetical protein ABK040_000311 [Willaertia magna]
MKPILHILLLFVFVTITAVTNAQSWTSSQTLNFGSVSSVYENTLVACTTDKNGECKVYVKDANNNWITTTALTPPAPLDIPRLFGSSVSIYKNRIAIGDKSFSKVYIYERDTTNINVWNLQDTLTPEGSSITSNNFGTSLSLYENNILVGATTDQVNNINSGSAYLFTWASNKWSLAKRLTPETPISGQLFGYSVTIYNDYAVVGTAHSTFFTYLFDPALGWSFISEKVLTRLSGVYGAVSVSMYQNNLVVVANKNVGGVGTVCFYQLIGVNWAEQNTFLVDCGDDIYKNSPTQVSIQGKTATVGLIGDQSRNLEGKAVVFVQTDKKDWILDSTIPGNGQYYFGATVSLFDNTLVVGSDTPTNLYIYGKGNTQPQPQISQPQPQLSSQPEPKVSQPQPQMSQPQQPQPETCPNGWKENVYGAPKPTITTFYNKDIKKFVLNIEMFKNTLANQITLDTITLSKTEAMDDTCNAVPTKNEPFGLIKETSCSRTYEFQFDSSEFNREKTSFTVTVSEDGNSLIYTSYIVTSYSFNDNNFAFTISEPLLVESDVTGTIAKESSFVISSTIVITGLVIAGLIASVIVIYYTMKRKDNNNATKATKLEESSSSVEMPTMV